MTAGRNSCRVVATLGLLVAFGLSSLAGLRPPLAPSQRGDRFVDLARAVDAAVLPGPARAAQGRSAALAAALPGRPTLCAPVAARTPLLASLDHQPAPPRSSPQQARAPPSV